MRIRSVFSISYFLNSLSILAVAEQIAEINKSVSFVICGGHASDSGV